MEKLINDSDIKEANSKVNIIVIATCFVSTATILLDDLISIKWVSYGSVGVSLLMMFLLVRSVLTSNALKEKMYQQKNPEMPQKSNQKKILIALVIIAVVGFFFGLFLALK